MQRFRIVRACAAIALSLAAAAAFAQAPGGPRGGLGGRGGPGGRGGRGGGAGRNLIGVVTSISKSQLTFRRPGGRGVTEVIVPLQQETAVSRLKPMKLGDVKAPAWARVRGFADPGDPDAMSASLITVAEKIPEKSDGGFVLGIASGVMTVSGDTTATLKIGDRSLRLVIGEQTLVYGETPAKLADLKVGDNVMVNPKDDSGSAAVDGLFILPEGDLPAIGGRRGFGGRGGPGGPGGRGGRGGRGRGAPPVNSIEDLV
jgi:hypothetical protein